MIQTLDKIPEITLQYAVRRIISQPATVWYTVEGKSFQVLSPGFIASQAEGPDFRAMALLIDGEIYIGQGEFHRKSSDWHLHHHDDNPRFTSTILHIVVNNDKPVASIPHTLVIEEEKIREFLQRQQEENDPAIIDTLAEIQHFALIRLMRKAAEVTQYVQQYGLEQGVRKTVEEFLHSFEKKRRRPCYTSNQIEKIGYDFLKCASLQALLDNHSITPSIPEIFSSFLHDKFSIEGEHLRREIFLNCLFPLAIALSSKQRRMGAFTWFWSIKSLQTYGILLRQFPHISQEYLWQQQGMLEYRRMNGERGNMSAEALYIYGFDKVFDFFKDAGTLINDNPLGLTADYDIAEDIIDLE